MNDDPLTRELDAHLALSSARLTVMQAQLDQREAADAEIAALGIDLDTLIAQHEADEQEAKQDQALMRQLQQQVATATDAFPDTEQKAIERRADAVVERAEARAERRTHLAETMKTVVSIESKHGLR